MQSSDLYKSIQPWIDENGLVKSRASQTSTQNGLLFTGVYIVLSAELPGGVINKAWFLERVKSCFKKPGLLMRTPKGDGGLEQFDDYLGVVTACLAIGDADTPREILWYGVRHFGFYNNSDSFTWSAWLWRYPHVFLLYLIASYRWLKWPLFIFYAIAEFFMNPSPDDGSGVQLSWLYLHAGKSLGFESKEHYSALVSMLPTAFADYYDYPAHPFQNAVKQIQGN
jgi:hypothetical protein